MEVTEPVLVVISIDMGGGDELLPPAHGPLRARRQLGLNGTFEAKH